MPHELKWFHSNCFYHNISSYVPSGELRWLTHAKDIRPQTYPIKMPDVLAWCPWHLMSCKMLVSFDGNGNVELYAPQTWENILWTNQQPSSLQVNSQPIMLYIKFMLFFFIEMSQLGTWVEKVHFNLSGQPWSCQMMSICLHTEMKWPIIWSFSNTDSDLDKWKATLNVLQLILNYN